MSAVTKPICVENGRPPLIDQQQVDAINELVVGWMEPVFKRTDPVTGHVLNGLGPSDFRRVQAGYGCPRCLAIFRTYLVSCPVCRFVRNLEEDVVAPPQHWVDHLKDREAVESGVPLSFDEFMSEVLSDPDIEKQRL